MRPSFSFFGRFAAPQPVELFASFRVEAILEPAGNVRAGTGVTDLLITLRQHRIHLAFEGHR